MPCFDSVAFEEHFSLKQASIPISPSVTHYMHMFITGTFLGTLELGNHFRPKETLHAYKHFANSFTTGTSEELLLQNVWNFGQIFSTGTFTGTSKPFLCQESFFPGIQALWWNILHRNVRNFGWVFNRGIFTGTHRLGKLFYSGNLFRDTITLDRFPSPPPKIHFQKLWPHFHRTSTRIQKFGVFFSSQEPFHRNTGTLEFFPTNFTMGP